MRIICAECERDLGEKEPLEDRRTSHTFCDECMAMIRARRIETTTRKRKEEVR